MKTNHLSNEEFIDYMDRYSNDPNVRRLVSIIVNNETSLYQDLVDVGMHEKDLTFEEDCMVHTPGEYIVHLQKSRDYAQEDCDDYKYKYEQELTTVKELKARTVAELIAELHQEIRTSDFRASEANKNAARADTERADALAKLKVWKALTSPYAQSYNN